MAVLDRLVNRGAMAESAEPERRKIEFGTRGIRVAVGRGGDPASGIATEGNEGKEG